MHDLMNELAVSVAGKRSTIVDPNQETFDENHRHLSFNFCVDLSEWRIPNSMRKATKMRTFLFLDQNFYPGSEKSLRKSFCSTIVSNFKYLRMLSLDKLGIRSLPNCLRKLKHLRYLELSGNPIARLPNWIVELVSLETLDLTECYDLKELHRDIKKMVNLRHLVLEDCSQLKAMPRGMGELTCLCTLDKFVLNKDGAGLGELSKLTELRGNLEINNLWHGKDHHLSSSYDGAILKEKHLDSLALEWSKIDYNKGVRMAQDSNVFALLEALQPHSNVKQLSLEYYSGLMFPNWLTSLVNISRLTLSHCLALQHLPPLDHLPFLRLLYLEDMDSLEFITISAPTSTLPATFFPSLIKVFLNGCPNLKGWLMEPISSSSCSSSTAVMPSFPCLSTLKVRSCPKLTSMPLYPNLECLDLWDSSWDVLPWVVPVTGGEAYDIGVSKLTTMGIGEMGSVPEGIGNLTSLQSLKISDCHNLASLPQAIGNLTSLQSLSISRCSNFASLPQGIGNLTSLQSLSISRCSNFASLPQGIGNLTSLQSLSILDCRNLESLSDQWMGRLISLQKLEIYDCPQLASVPKWIGNLPSLQSLSIGGFSESASLPEWIGDLPSLQNLRIVGFSNLVSLPEGLRHLRSLKSLGIRHCPNLASLEGIGNLTSLQSLSIWNCPNFASLPEGIGNLTTLQSLSISDCPIVEKRCKKEIGEDWPNMAHIPDIFIQGRKF